MTRSKSDANDFLQVSSRVDSLVGGDKMDAPCKITIKLSDNSYMNMFEDFYTF